MLAFPIVCKCRGSCPTTLADNADLPGRAHNLVHENLLGAKVACRSKGVSLMGTVSMNAERPIFSLTHTR